MPTLRVGFSSANRCVSAPLRLFVDSPALSTIFGSNSKKWSAKLGDEQQDRWILDGAQVLSHPRLAQKGFQTQNPLRPVGGPKPSQSHIGAKAEGRMMNAETPDKAA